MAYERIVSLDPAVSVLSTDILEKSDATGASPSTKVTVAQLIGAMSGPLTTKGDIYTYSTTNARLPIGTNGSILEADSTQATGNGWSAVLKDSSLLSSVAFSARQLIANDGSTVYQDWSDYTKVKIGGGAASTSQGTESVAIGFVSAPVQGNNCVAIGGSAGSPSQGNFGVIVGHGSSATGVNNTIIGASSTTNGVSNTLIGYSINGSSYNNVIALGAGAVPSANNQAILPGSIYWTPSSLGSGSPSNVNFLRGDGTWADVTTTGGNLIDTTTFIVGHLDPTKKTGFSESSATTGATTLLNFVQTTDRTLTFPDATDTLVGRATSDTLTNKTISGISNTITNVSLQTGVRDNLPVSNLNSGIGASGSSFWRGDGTWAPVGGGGGNLPAIFVSVNTTMNVNTRYFVTNPTLSVQLTLPAISALGDIIEIKMAAAGGWKIPLDVTQQIISGIYRTTGGALESSSAGSFDCVRLECITPNTTWMITSGWGQPIIV